MSDVFELEVLSSMPNYYSWIMEAFAPLVRGRVVEYGAGKGTISERLAPLADKLILVEPMANLAAVLRAKFRDHSKVEVAEVSLEQHTVSIDDGAVDTVVMVNVLEHIQNDREVLFQLCRILRPDGHLLIFVPALRGLMSRLDLLFGHFRRYHRAELVEKITEAGGEVQLCRYFDFLGVAPWFLLNKLMGATTFNPKLVYINDKFVVPISAAVERVISPPFGKNIILIARKR